MDIFLFLYIDNIKISSYNPKKRIAFLKNTDRSSLNIIDLTPADVSNMFVSADNGSTKQQSKIANLLIEKDPAISQAWNVRVASIAACEWEIEGENADFVKKTIENITPNYESGLVTFRKLLNALQSAVLHGFQVSEIYWLNGGASIEGFRIYDQSLFSFVDSELPYYNDVTNYKEKAKNKITFPRWLYHTTIHTGAEPLKAGLVRPLAYLYSFRRHVIIQYLSGIEKYGTPFPMVSVDDSFYEDNTIRQRVEEMLENWTANGWGVSPRDAVDITFPASGANFQVETFLTFLDYTEKQIFRLLLGQDSTSSAENSNRSTAQVHNLVRKDLLASDSVAVEETINNQIIRPLIFANFGANAIAPKFKFKFKGISELAEVASLVKTLNECGYEIDEKQLSEKFGLKLAKKQIETKEVQ
jgi:phage gp29-like protein